MKRIMYAMLLNLLVLCAATSVSSAQSWMLNPNILYAFPLDTRVGIGTTAPIFPLQIESDGTRPAAATRFVQRLLPQFAFDSTAPNCWAAGHLGLASGDALFSFVARRGDMVLNTAIDQQNPCGNDIVLDAQTVRGAIRFATGSTTANIPIGGIESWQRMVLDAPDGNTRLELQAVDYEGEHKNSMLRFSRANGWSREALGTPWAIGMDDNHNLASQYNNTDKSVFRIGRSLTEFAQFNINFLTILDNGRVLIGDPMYGTSGTVTLPGRDLKDSKLQVNGTVVASEYLCIAQSNWPDFVFADDYKLASLEEVEQHIKEKRHLPDIPSAQEVQTSGVSLNEIQAKLLQKVEELTLYVIEQNKKVSEQEQKIQALEAKLNSGR